MPKYFDFQKEITITKNDEKEKRDKTTIKDNIKPAGFYRLYLEIAQAVKYVHDKNVVLKDLKPDNILLNESLIDKEKLVFEGENDWGVVLADFGFSCLIKEGDEKSQECLEQRAGTLSYMPPEQLSIPARTTLKSDILALAKVIIWTSDISTIKAVYNNNIEINHNQLRTKLSESQTRFIPKVEEILLKMLSEEQNIRPSIDEFITKFENVCTDLAIENKYDYVICGHIHEPKMELVENENGKTTYLNL